MTDEEKRTFMARSYPADRWLAICRNTVLAVTDEEHAAVLAAEGWGEKELVTGTQYVDAVMMLSFRPIPAPLGGFDWEIKA